LHADTSDVERLAQVFSERLLMIGGQSCSHVGSFTMNIKEKAPTTHTEAPQARLFARQPRSAFGKLSVIWR
jgi:hypothetical protein